jgi:hypothetical protein
MKSKHPIAPLLALLLIALSARGQSTLEQLEAMCQAPQHYIACHLDVYGELALDECRRTGSGYLRDINFAARTGRSVSAEQHLASQQCIERAEQKFRTSFPKAIKAAGKNKRAIEGLRRHEVLFLTTLKATKPDFDERPSAYEARVRAREFDVEAAANEVKAATR